MHSFKLLFIILTITLHQSNCFAQDMNSLPQEKPNDKYVPVARKNMQKSPAYTFKNSTIFTTQVNIDAGGNNIVGDAGNEPSIAIDPTNPNRIVIGWRQFDDVNSDFRQAGYSYSTDGGNTWTFPGPIEPSIFRSDPVLDSDADGNFYYNSLTADSEMNMNCDIFRIQDGGVNWDSGTYAYGGDKQWMRIDKTDGIGSGNNYSFWSSGWSACYPGAFTRSIDSGDTYQSCVEVAGDPFWGTLAVGPDGAVYMVGTASSPIVLVKSTTAKDPSLSVTWDFTTVVNLNGELVSSSSLNPVGLLGQAWVDVDKSDGVGSGNVYVLATVRHYSNSDPADVMFARSTDGGVSFENPIQINTDSSNENFQWFGTMSVAPNGRIDVIWLDTRDATSSKPHNSALYYSYSIDQGDNWSPNQQISDYFDPHIGYPQQSKMGDYFDMKSDDNGAHLAWSNTLNNGEDVYYSHIVPEYLSNDSFTNKTNFLLNSFPNPFSKETTISFQTDTTSNIKLSIYDILGNEIVELFNDTVEASKKQLVTWNGKDNKGNKIDTGIYFCKLQSKRSTQSIRIILH